jgi:hypothetical protein
VASPPVYRPKDLDYGRRIGWGLALGAGGLDGRLDRGVETSVLGVVDVQDPDRVR